MLCFLHGYLLDGSGSNLWTRHIVQNLSARGESVHLVCQEPHPERFPFIKEAYEYDHQNQRKKLFVRNEGNVIFHKPKLFDWLPVFVGDKYEEFSEAIPLLKLSDKKISQYLTRNSEVILPLANQYGWEHILVNHTLLMSLVAHEVSQKTGIPFSIIPHGSGLEYAVKKQERLLKLAAVPMESAKKIFVVSPEIGERLQSIFPNQTQLPQKLTQLRVGVDTTEFHCLDTINVEKQKIAFLDTLPQSSKGKPAVDPPTDFGRKSLTQWMESTSQYFPKFHDTELENKLAPLNQNHDIAVFVGRLIVAKGLQTILLALPWIVKQLPHFRLLVVGHGPYREMAEAMIHAICQGDLAGLESILQMGSPKEDDAALHYLDGARDYLQDIIKDRSDPYCEAAKIVNADSVIFTGFLNHQQLPQLLPLAKVAVFPSVVPEAGPMVLLEAMASGCFPMGTNAAGMSNNLDIASRAVSQTQSDLMRISPDPKKAIDDLAQNLPLAMRVENTKLPLRKIAVEEFDWKHVAQRLINGLE